MKKGRPPAEIKSVRDEAATQGALAAIAAISQDRVSAYRYLFPELSEGKTKEEIRNKVYALYERNPHLELCEKMCYRIMGELARTTVEKTIKQALTNLDSMVKSYDKSQTLFRCLHKDPSVLDDIPDDTLRWAKKIKIKERKDGSAYIDDIDLKPDLSYLNLAWNIGADIAQRVRDEQKGDDVEIRLKKTQINIQQIPEKPVVDGKAEVLE